VGSLLFFQIVFNFLCVTFWLNYVSCLLEIPAGIALGCVFVFVREFV
jgi:hypothetical protein